MKLLSINEEILLLSIWKLKDDAYGVPIRGMVMDYTQNDVLYGTLYNSLDNLVKKGYVVTRQGMPTAERGGRSKVFYSLTNEGKEALSKARQLHRELWEDVPEYAFGGKKS